MRLHNAAEVPLDHAARVYCDGSWRPLLAAAALMAAVMGVTVYFSGDTGTAVPLAAFTGLVAGSFMLLFIQRFVQCMRRRNWLVAQTGEGIFLNLRWHLNRHLPESGPTVAYIPRDEIAAVGKTHERRRLPTRHGGETHFCYIDIYLRHEDTEALRAALHAERRLRGRGKRDVYPVRLPAPGVIRVLWDHIHPPENTAVTLLAGDYPRLADRSVVYGDWEKLGDAEKQSVIDDLWEKGDVAEAYRLYRAHHQKGQRAAKAHFAQLARAESGSAANAAPMPR